MAGIPSRGSDQFVVRFPPGMREQIRIIAEDNRRSMNAEIISLIETGMIVTGWDDSPSRNAHSDDEETSLDISMLAPELKHHVKVLVLALSAMKR